ncbi:MAG TPA: PASTA domain-containing protein [Microthrixaceae bacterium]|nr:PASTA domain-containing protein [Microthrixaceae bacterium]
MSSMTDDTGRVLGGRYRCLSLLGTGSSAQVFLAEDVRLRRNVAVKVLHPALAGDAGFLRRFRAEAQAAAALSHPNIVAVYDWSGDGDSPYLVTEYLSGGTLRTILDAGHRLSLSQALVVGLDACRALDHAHRHGFVHRDVKPANLLFGEDARLRIGDFGLARAVAEAGWTETGTVLGTIRYTSPEQARGERVDGRSDIYSLALVLVEAVTGEVPFASDTAVGMLTARLDTSLEVPDELGPLQPILARAGALDPADRPSAEQLGAALVAAATELPRPTPLPLTGTPPGPSPGPDATLVGSTAASPGAGPPPTPGGDSTGVLPLPDAGAEAVPEAGGRRRQSYLVLGVLGAMLAGMVGVVVAWTYLQSSVPAHAVPHELIGAQSDEVADLIGDYGWRLRFEQVRRDGTEAGEVVDTDPKPGTELKEGDRLTIFVSQGPTLVAVPDGLAGLTRAEAEARLQATNLVAEFIEEAHREVPVDVVIRVGDVASSVPKGSAVPLVVSTGPPLVSIPDLRGVDGTEAFNRLEGLGLVPSFTYERNRRFDADTVIRTEPGVDAQVPVGSDVVVVLSQRRGSRLPDFLSGEVKVPKLRGRDLDDAISRLAKDGLSVGQVNGDRNGEVYATRPDAGQKVPSGTAVDLWLE